MHPLDEPYQGETVFPSEDRVPFPGGLDGRQGPREESQAALARRGAGGEKPPRVPVAVPEPTVGVDGDEAHALHRLAVRGQLLRRPSARRREMDRRLGRGLHLDREGELPTDRHEVETERPGAAHDEERVFDDPLEHRAVPRLDRPTVLPDRIAVALEEVLELAFVRGRPAADHGRSQPVEPLRECADFGGPVAASAGVEIAAADLPVARVLAAVVADADRRRTLRGVASTPARFRLAELRGRLLRDRVFEDSSRLVTRLRKRGLLVELPESHGEKVYQVPYPDELRRILLDEIERAETAEPSALQPVPDESAEIRSMDHEFLDLLREVLRERLEATLEFGRSFDVDRLAKYLRELFGEALYFDSLISILQQYALADVPLLAPTGRTTGATGFHLALFGPPGTGKTFSIDDLVRGNPRSGVPPHGLPGRNRYCGGITPVQFLRVGSFYQGRTFNFIVPEFNDWFKYKGMVEPLKLVMEQREVKWETTLGTVGPYTFRSFFSVNYNVRTAGAQDYWTTIADPNFAALEDRMLLRFHAMTRERFRAVEASAERLELGDLDFALAQRIRDHLVLVHAIETGHPLVAGKFRSRPVRLDRKLYASLREVSEKALKATSYPKFSPRLKSRAVRLAAAASLIRSLADPGEPALDIGPTEAEFARRFYEEEIRAREGRHGRAAS